MVATYSAADRLIIMICAPSTTCVPTATATLATIAGKGRAQRVFHLHRLEHGDTLSAGDRFARADEKLQDFAVHRRLDAAVAGAGLRRRLGHVLEPHARLAAMAQNVSLVSGHEHPGIGGRCRPPTRTLTPFLP
jgi:hypothetical protein